MKERNIGIDILKFFAVLLITNSHMDLLYVKYGALATGGAIGDVLFFFCSGFTLFLSRKGRFDNWYKRRINRIYPTVFAWAIISAFLLDNHYSMDFTILHGGGWFVTCIMIYYIFLYFIQKYMINNLKLSFIIISFVCIVWYILMDKPIGYNMYGETYFKWGHYFLFMLMGAMMGISQRYFKPNIKYDLLKFTSCLTIYYGILFLCKIHPEISKWQIVSLIPLFFIVFYFYKICNSNYLKMLYNSKYIGWTIKLISGLCLEIYIVQGTLLTDKINNLFPLNIPIMFIVIIIAAYILRCCSRIFAQTFKDKDYDWKEIIQLF